jgi:hypothetical protein
MAEINVPMPDPKLPTLEAFNAFVKGAKERQAFENVIRQDFIQACKDLTANPSPYASRNVVRCFGSLVDGLANTMMEVAVDCCNVWNRPLNPFLHAKANGRETSLLYRIQTAYRLISEFLPDSPLARVGDERWNALQTSLALRNRVTHPATIAGLEVGEGELVILMNTATAFLQDLAAFCYWSTQAEQEMFNRTVRRRIVFAPSAGRNDPCPCGKLKKFKYCCGKVV